MAARYALLVIGLLLAAQSPSLAKVKLHHAAKLVPGSAAHAKAKIKSDSAIEAQTGAAEPISDKTEVRDEPAVMLQPDGTEDDSKPAKALYTDSDDVG